MADKWTVTSQQQRNVLLPGQGFQTVMEVHFQTAKGTIGSVQVPLNQFNAAEVSRRIDEYVAHISAVEQL